ncbi:hypothetical protein NW767_014901 [Fusarium falciforme]|nr:hypothetical protein NW767_014901 [Fusarium falciforme]
MATALSPSTWIQALPVRLQRLLGTQHPSSSSSDQASKPKNPTEVAADHDDEWGDWVIPAPECEEQVNDAPVLVGEPVEDEILSLNITFEELMARQRAMACNAWKVEVRDKDRKSSDGEKEEPFHLEEIPAGIRMPCHTPPDSDDTQVLGTCIFDLDAGGW